MYSCVPGRSLVLLIRSFVRSPVIFPALALCALSSGIRHGEYLYYIIVSIDIIYASGYLFLGFLFILHLFIYEINVLK